MNSIIGTSTHLSDNMPVNGINRKPPMLFIVPTSANLYSFSSHNILNCRLIWINQRKKINKNLLKFRSEATFEIVTIYTSFIKRCSFVLNMNSSHGITWDRSNSVDGHEFDVLFSKYGLYRAHFTGRSFLYGIALRSQSWLYSLAFSHSGIRHLFRK